MALPQHKTPLSVLRSILGPGPGGPALFADKIGRSESWLKKACCGQIPLMRDAAILIAYETGVSLKWLMDGDASKPAVDSQGNPYTLETYAAHRERDRQGPDWEDWDCAEAEVLGCFHELLQILFATRRKNRAGVFAFYLGQFSNEMAAKFGKADIYQSKSAAAVGSDLARLVMEWDAAKASKHRLATRQTLQPSRGKGAGGESSKKRKRPRK